MLDFILGKDIASYVKAHRHLVVWAIVFTAISSLFVVVPAYLLQPFIDEGMKAGSNPVTWKIPWVAIGWHSGLQWHRTSLVLIKNVSPNHLLLILTLVAFLSVLFKSITIYVGQLAGAAFANRAIKSLRIDLFKKFLSLPLGFYHKRKAGELISRSSADLTVMQDRIANILIGLVQQPLTALVFLLYLFLVNYRLTLLVFFVFPVIWGLTRLFGRKVKKHSTRVQDTTSHVISAYQEMLLCLKVVQGFCMQPKESRKFSELADLLYKRVMHWNRWYLGIGPMMDSTVFLILPVVLVLGKIYFHHTLGELLSMVYAFSRVYGPIKSLARLNNELRTLQGATDRVFTILKTTPAIRDRQGAGDLPPLKGAVVFRDVGFSYDSSTPVLQDISLEIKAGEMVAFVGSTGAGKSTLLDLVPRFYDVTAGSITIDGMDIREVTMESLRSQIGIVNQEVLLFHDTIANNIASGIPDKGMDRIVEAAKAAYAHEFIMALPDGYDSIVGDRGTLLSGGQRQRIAIARAILPEPSILILDEAASALDTESERLVQEAVEKLRGEHTILVVAHRLSTVRKADRIYVLEHGRIIEWGRRDELLARDGRFRELHDMQFRP